MANRIQVRRDTAENWTTANPVLAAGETGLETDTKRRKTGDGSTAWTALPYVFDKTIADATYTTPAAADATYAPITGSANYVAPAQLDAANAANINTPASATATALSATYAPVAGSTNYAAFKSGGYGGNYVTALGDSITALNGSTTNNQLADTWQNWVYAFSGGRLRWGGMPGAQAGYTLAQIRDSLVALVTGLNPLPNACMVLGGTNDAGSSTFVLSDSMTALNTIYDMLIAAGIRPIACTIPPRADSTTANQKADKLNAAIRNNASKRGLDLLDFHKLLVNPATGGYKTGLTLDNVHPSFLGGKMMGQYGAGVLAPRFPDARPYLVEHAVDSTDALAAKGLFLVDTNADGISDGWTSFSAAPLATFSRVADADGVTTWQRITVASGNGNTLLQTAPGGIVSPGDIIELSGRIQTSGFDAVVTPTSTFSFNLSAQIVGVTAGAPGSAISPAYSLHADIADGVFTERLAVGVGATGQVKVNLQTNNSPSTGSAWVQFANITLRNLTTQGVL